MRGGLFQLQHSIFSKNGNRILCQPISLAGTLFRVYTRTESILFFTGSLNQSLIYHLGAAPYTALERQEDEEDSDCSRYAKGLY